MLLPLSRGRRGCHDCHRLGSDDMAVQNGRTTMSWLARAPPVAAAVAAADKKVTKSIISRKAPCRSPIDRFVDGFVFCRDRRARRLASRCAKERLWHESVVRRDGAAEHRRA